jgi:hypothetical protein
MHVPDAAKVCRAGLAESMRPGVSHAPLALFASWLSVSCQLEPPSERFELSLVTASAAASDPCKPAQDSPRDPLLPERPGRFCRDPGAPLRHFGEPDGEPLRRACERVLGPTCFADLGHGLERVSVTRYVDKGTPERGVDAVLSRFESADSAHAHFSEVLIGDADPANIAAAAVQSAGVALIEGGRLFAWRGRHVLRLGHFDATATPELPRVERDLSELGAALLERLPEAEGWPRALGKLPKLHRLPLGLRLVLGDALGVPGLGANAIGYYRDGQKRWRVLAISRPDLDSAKDVMSTLGRHPHADKIKGIPGVLEYVERRLPSEPRVQWVIGQRGDTIYGIGDEAAALPEFMPAAAEAKVKLSLHEKLVKLSRIHLE